MRFFFALAAFCAPLLAQNCTFTVTPSSLNNVVSGGSTGILNVVANAGCSWTATSDLSWIKILAGSPGNGAGSVSYSIDANVTSAQRTGSITVAGQRISVTQAGAVCSYVVDPKTATIGVSGGTGSFKVTTGCLWRPESNRGDFLTLPGVDPNNPYRVGNSTVNYTATPNPCVYSRAGAVNIISSSTEASFNLTQDGSPANLTLSATEVNAAPDEADARLVVTTGNGCFWNATSDVSWMRIINGAGAGNGAITYHLLANSVAPRTGTIQVGNLKVTVTQASSGPAAPAVAAVESAANYKNDSVAPGEIVVLFGTNMGPAQLTPLVVKDGSVTRLLAGTQVLFDGNAAPLIYARADQVSAIVPYGLAGKSSTQVQVSYNGIVSPPVTMPVASSHPAIFTLDATGLGPGAILNQDTSINSGANRAAVGTVVSIYMTGAGTTKPSLSDGAVTGTDLPLVTLPVTVSIGGVDAKVEYAGGVPGAVAGLTQINAVVPPGVSGASVPVVVSVGGAASSAGVTMGVR